MGRWIKDYSSSNIPYQQVRTRLKEPHSKKLKGYDIYELRVKLASDIVRLFYFYDDEQLYVITSGFVKKQNKTSKREIERAIRTKKEYEEEHHEKLWLFWI